jgi:hypothetical protein
MEDPIHDAAVNVLGTLNVLGAEAPEDIDEFRRLDVGDMDRGAAPARPRQIVHLPRAEVIDDQHLPIAIEEDLGEVAADETGATGDNGLARHWLLIVAV